MALPMQCGNCGYNFKVPNEYAGRRGRCPKCKTMLDVPPGGAKPLRPPADSSDAPPKVPPRLGDRPGHAPPPRTVPSAVGQAPGISAGLPQIAVDDAPVGARRGAPAARVAARGRSGVPVWLWISLGSAALVLTAVTLWVFLPREDAADRRAAAPGGASGLAQVERLPALPVDRDDRSLAQLVDTTSDAVAPSTPPDDLPILSDLPQAVVASTLEEVKRAVVKVEVPVAGGTKVESGSGFFVDGRGWIATNDHVIKNINSAARVRLADGMICRIEGILARVPDRDLALLQLAERPYQITILDIRRQSTPRLGEQVYAFGHPYNADFSLSKGIVSRVLDTGELNEDARRLLRSTIGTPDNVIWIQHDAKISPGNSGGPLIDEQGRVLGMNSFVHLQADFGYASDVRYLRDLVERADGEPTPLPPASNVAQPHESGEFLRVDVAPEQLRELYARAERFHFQPDNEEQYAALANLAAMLTVAKHVSHQPGRLPAEAAATVGRTADELVARLEAVEFRAEQYEAVNRFARNVAEQPGQGVFAFGTVVGQGPNALILEVDGGKSFIVQVGPELAKADPLSRWLVLGVYSSQVVQVQRSEGGEPRPMRVLMMYYMLRT